MFIGHIAVGLAAKRVAPRTSLGTLAVAVEFSDLLWPIFLLLGWEQVRIAPRITVVTPLDFVSYPISHSLLADIGWASLFVGLYLIVKRYPKGAFVIWGCVMSHWILDVISHRPDMPLYPGGRVFIGLGLWNSLPATLLIEGDVCCWCGDLPQVHAGKGQDRSPLLLGLDNRFRHFLPWEPLWPTAAQPEGAEDHGSWWLAVRPLVLLD